MEKFINDIENKLKSLGFNKSENKDQSGTQTNWSKSLERQMPGRTIIINGRQMSEPTIKQTITSTVSFYKGSIKDLDTKKEDEVLFVEFNQEDQDGNIMLQDEISFYKEDIDLFNDLINHMQ